MAFIRLKNISKNHKGKPILAQTSMEINEGDFFAFLGAEKSGKTVVINMIMDFTRPDTGEILIDGKNPSEFFPEYKKKTAYVPSDPQYIETLRVDKIINNSLSTPLEMLDNETKKIIEFLIRGISKPMGQLPLSSRKRVALAAALAKKAPFLILDEPFLGIDRESADTLATYLKNLNKNGTTILMGTRDMARAQMLATRIALFNKGSVLDIMETEKLLSSKVRYVTLKTQDDISAMLKLFDIKKFSIDGKYISFLYRQDMDSLIRALSEYKIDDMRISLPSLKETIAVVSENCLKRETEDA